MLLSCVKKTMKEEMISHSKDPHRPLLCAMVSKWMDGWMDGWRDGWRDGWMDGWMDDGWMDGWMDG